MKDLKELSSFQLVDLRNYLENCLESAKTDYVHVKELVNPEIFTAMNDQLAQVEGELEKRGE